MGDTNCSHRRTVGHREGRDSRTVMLLLRVPARREMMWCSPLVVRDLCGSTGRTHRPRGLEDHTTVTAFVQADAVATASNTLGDCVEDTHPTPELRRQRISIRGSLPAPSAPSAQ